MRYNRKGNTAFCETSHDFNSEIAYIIKVVDVYSAAEVHPSYWLTDKEKLYFACACFCVNNGECSIVSPDSMDVFRKYFRNNVKKPEIHRYFNTLKDKGWLDRNPKGRCVIIPVLFEEMLMSKDHLSFEIKLNFEKDEINRLDLGRIDQ